MLEVIGELQYFKNRVRRGELTSIADLFGVLSLHLNF